MSEQSANAVVMIRPSQFYPNPETALDNAFQQEVAAESSDLLTARARAEFDEAARMLSAAAVKVHVFDDTPAPEKPDAIFPNNWFSTHHDGRIALYPMYTPSRRAERRSDVIASLQQQYRVSEIVDYSPFEERGFIWKGPAASSLIMKIGSPTSLSPGGRIANWWRNFVLTSIMNRSHSGAVAMTAARFITPMSCYASERSSRSSG